MDVLAEEFESSDFELDPAAIRWCLTVPALWSEPAKDSMRSAAFRAGESLWLPARARQPQPYYH